MTTLLIIIHVLISLFLIGVVLIQGGKGAELGSAFGGGSSHTLFGARGAATVLSKITTIVAILFMVTSLILTIISVRQPSVVKSSIIPEEKTQKAPSEGVKKVPEGVKPVSPEQPLPEKPAQK
jgi:preprotein translocase subunit SecG